LDLHNQGQPESVQQGATYSNHNDTCNYFSRYLLVTLSLHFFDRVLVEFVHQYNTSLNLPLYFMGWISTRWMIKVYFNSSLAI